VTNLVQREITVTIKGPEELVDSIAQSVMLSLPTGVNDAGDGKVRWSIQGRKDWLDAEWNVIPPDQIIAALAEYRRLQRGDTDGQV
jgi:hypothetical protein